MMDAKVSEKHVHAHKQHHACAAPQTPAPHVLLVEDDVEMRAAISDRLREAGMRVTECPDAFHWIDFCISRSHDDDDGDQTYDVVVSDIRMPGVNGLEVLDGLRHARRRPPTILITAFGDAQTHRKARELGAAAVLDKPFEVRELLQLIDAVLAGAAPDAPANDHRSNGSNNNRSSQT